MAVEGYDIDTYFNYVYTVTLPLKIWPWIKIGTPPWVMDDDFVKY